MVESKQLDLEVNQFRFSVSFTSGLIKKERERERKKGKVEKEGKTRKEEEEGKEEGNRWPRVQHRKRSIHRQIQREREIDGGSARVCQCVCVCVSVCRVCRVRGGKRGKRGKGERGNRGTGEREGEEKRGTSKRTRTNNKQVEPFPYIYIYIYIYIHIYHFFISVSTTEFALKLFLGGLYGSCGNRFEWVGIWSRPTVRRACVWVCECVSLSVYLSLFGGHRPLSLDDVGSHWTLTGVPHLKQDVVDVGCIRYVGGIVSSWKVLFSGAVQTSRPMSQPIRPSELGWLSQITNRWHAVDVMKERQSGTWARGKVAADTGVRQQQPALL